MRWTRRARRRGLDASRTTDASKYGCSSSHVGWMRGRAGNTLVWRGGRSMPASRGRRSMLPGGGGRSTPVVGGRSTQSGARRATTANKESPLGLAPSGMVLPVFAKAYRSGNPRPCTYILPHPPVPSDLKPQYRTDWSKPLDRSPSNSVIHLTSSTPSLTLWSSNESVTDSGPLTPSPTNVMALSAPSSTSTTDNS